MFLISLSQALIFSLPILSLPPSNTLSLCNNTLISLIISNCFLRPISISSRGLKQKKIKIFLFYHKLSFPVPCGGWRLCDGVRAGGVEHSLVFGGEGEDFDPKEGCRRGGAIGWWRLGGRNYRWKIPYYPLLCHRK